VTLLEERLDILEAKIQRLVKASDAPKMEFLSVIASHDGHIMQDSISVSFNRFKEKYGNEKFEETLKNFEEDGIVSEKHGLQFAVLNERGDYNHDAGGELCKFVSKLVFDLNPQIVQTLDQILKEPEGNELLKYIAKEKGIFIIDGQEPKIKEVVGKKTYERIVESLAKNNILVEYAWSSRKHGYTGYRLLPSVGDYLRAKLGIFELSEEEKIVLAYIESMNEIFGYPTSWYIWFNYPSEYHHRTLKICSLHKKLLASLLYRTEEDIQRIIDDLKSKNLISQVDLGYTRSGSHRGIALQLSEFGQRTPSQTKEEVKARIESKIKEIFSNQDNRMVYHLFCRDKIPLKILSLVKEESVNVLLKAGLIGEEQGVFLAFKEGTSYYNYTTSAIDPKEIQRGLEEKCADALSREERMFLGLLSECKNVVLGKYPDWSSWSPVTPRTQRRYDDAYGSLTINFPYLKKLFSYLTGLSPEKTDKITSDLEKNMFLVQDKNLGCGFPGYAMAYKIPVKFSFDIDTESLKSKLHEYIDFLAKDVEKHYNQLIFLDFLTRIYDARECDFLVSISLMKDLLALLDYTPPPKYLPIYTFEEEAIVLYPWIKEELKKEIYESKSKLIEPSKNMILQLTGGYQKNISYGFSTTTTKEGHFIIEIESPDPSVGTVSFIITPWITPLGVQEISSLCVKSSTVNLFSSYPNYPQLKSMITIDGRFNLVIIRHKKAYLFLKKVDQITRTIFARLGDQFEIIKQEERIRREIEELEEKYPNLRKVRFIIPEAEELLRDAIRPGLIKEFGDNWQDRVRQRFPKAEGKKQSWEKEHPGEQRDILQGISLGDFATLFEDKTFSLIKDCFKNFGLVKASLQVFLSKKEYHHGKPKDDKDVSDEDVDTVSTAYRTLSEMVKR